MASSGLDRESELCEAGKFYIYLMEDELLATCRMVLVHEATHRGHGGSGIEN